VDVCVKAEIVDGDNGEIMFGDHGDGDVWKINEICDDGKSIVDATTSMLVRGEGVVKKNADILVSVKRTLPSPSCSRTKRLWRTNFAFYCFCKENRSPLTFRGFGQRCHRL